VKILSRREARIVEALAETMFPEGGRIASSKAAKVVDAVDSFMADVPPTERVMMRAMFGLFEVGMGVLGPGRSMRFSKAHAHDQKTYIADWESSRFYLRRLAFQALRSTFFITYFQSDAVLDGIGVEDGEQALARWQQARGLVSDGPDTDPSARPVRRLREARSGK
jgi:hypothetical protein